MKRVFMISISMIFGGLCGFALASALGFIGVLLSFPIGMLIGFGSHSLSEEVF